MCWNWLAKMVTNAKDFLFNSDYAQDQIVFFKEFTYTNITLGDGDDPIRVAHGLDFIPLIFGVWDNSPDFNNPKSINSEGKDSYSDSTGELKPCNQVFVYSDETNISFRFFSKMVNGSLSPTNFYIRLYAFEPSDSHATIAPTSNHASKFVFNTKYNYLKLKEQGIANAEYGQVTFNHALGYVPQVLDWADFMLLGEHIVIYVDSFSNFWPLNNPLLEITSNILVFNRMNGRATKHHYRIYYDEA